MKRSWKSISFFSLLLLGALAFFVFMVACGGGHSSTGTIQNPTPSIQGISPSFVTAGASSQTISINGSGFLSSSTVTYEGVSHAASFVSSRQLNLILNGADVATVGNFPIVVTNPPPGGGNSSAAVFGIWSSSRDVSSSLTFSLPPLGATPQVTYYGSSSYALFSLEIAAPNPHYNNALTPVIRLFALSNASKENIQEWFEQTIDDASGTLLASGAFQMQQLANGSAMVSVGPIPSTYQGGPVADAYMLAPSQDIVYVITQSQSAQLTEFGYSASSVPEILTSILGSAH